MATVVPCANAATSSGSAPSAAQPASTPSDWSRGVEGTLAMRIRPSGATATTSVKVPPTSTPSLMPPAPSPVPVMPSPVR